MNYILKKLIENNLKTFSHLIKRQYPDMYQIILTTPGDTFSEKAFIYVHSLTDKDYLCQYCLAHNKKFISFNAGFRLSCNDPLCKKLAQKNMHSTLRESGSHPLQQACIRELAAKSLTGVDWGLRDEKSKNTCMTRYGVTSASKLETVKQKRVDTIIANFGVTHQMLLDEVKEKIKKTNNSRYGVENVFQNSEIKEKSKDTCMRKYGADHYSKTEIARTHLSELYHGKPQIEKDLIQHKRDSTNITRYGGSPMNTPKVKEKLKNSNLKKYGVPYPLQDFSIRQRISESRMAHTFENFVKFNKLYSPHFSLDEFKGIAVEHSWVCNSCGGVFTDSLKGGLRCPSCIPASRSIQEHEVATFIQSLGVNIIQNSRSIIPPLEIDIFIPTLNMGIEYCGLYWHSTKFKDQHSHIKKLAMCKERGINLIQIFEDEWLFKQDIVKSRLKYAISKQPALTYARKCEIKEITSAESSAFLNEHHIQGSVNASIRVGAFFQSTLVAVMTFGKLRKALGHASTTGAIELLRFSSSGNIPGIGSKLLTWVERAKTPSKIISYSDNRWGVGNIYQILGFKKIATGTPNYWYWKLKPIRLHRYSFRKNVLVKNYPALSHLPESEIMQNLGYHKIWDCGSTKWEKCY